MRGGEGAVAEDGALNVGEVFCETGVAPLEGTPGEERLASEGTPPSGPLHPIATHSRLQLRVRIRERHYFELQINVA